jgi:hypothetical protein
MIVGGKPVPDATEESLDEDEANLTPDLSGESKSSGDTRRSGDTRASGDTRSSGDTR